MAALSIEHADLDPLWDGSECEKASDYELWDDSYNEVLDNDKGGSNSECEGVLNSEAWDNSNCKVVLDVVVRLALPRHLKDFQMRAT